MLLDLFSHRDNEKRMTEKRGNFNILVFLTYIMQGLLSREKSRAVIGLFFGNEDSLTLLDNKSHKCPYKYHYITGSAGFYSKPLSKLLKSIPKYYAELNIERPEPRLKSAMDLGMQGKQSLLLDAVVVCVTVKQQKHHLIWISC